MGARHVVIMGLMASGKSSVGRVLAGRLGLPYLDNDELLESRQGETASEIEAGSGLDALHRLEAEVLREALGRRHRTVITAAASTVEDAKARRALQPHQVVWLEVGAEVLARRVATGDGHRPLQGPELLSVLRDQVARRGPLFAEVADVTVQTATSTPEEIAEAVSTQLDR